MEREIDGGLVAGEPEHQRLGVDGPGDELGPAPRVVEVDVEAGAEDLAGAGGLVLGRDPAQEVGEDAVHGPEDMP